MSRWRLVGVIVGTAALLASGLPAAAQEASSVTLEAAERSIDYGQYVTLTGSISPAAADETVAIVDGDGALHTQVVTVADGSFSARLLPAHNLSLVAQWNEAVSPPVDITVRPSVVARLKAVRLFGRAVVRGETRPSLEGGWVAVTVWRNGRRLWTKRVTPNGSRFAFWFDIGKPGRFRARVRTVHPDFAPASASAGSAATTPLPSLASGSRGIYVKLLERRIASLGYHLDGVNHRYDYRTSDAVLAFNKVQGRARIGTVDRSTWRALVDPIRPKPRARSPRFHIEVDQSRQVLYTVRDGKIDQIIHVSTGAGYATRDGVWHVHRKLAGYSGNRLYYPSYFDGLRAIHGWPSVPTYNASHGCVRVPNWTAIWIFGLAEIGTEVRIYH